MSKPLTLLESVLVQMLVQMMVAPKKPHLPSDWDYDEMVAILMRTGLTKQQAIKALGR